MPGTSSRRRRSLRNVLSDVILGFKLTAFIIKSFIFDYVAEQLNLYRKPSPQKADHSQKGRIWSLRACLEGRVKINQKDFCPQEDLRCLPARH
jgi:hypothetical protein